MITIINYSERYKADFIRLNTEWIENKDSYKLAKMAVSPNAQGHHIGYQLGTALIDYARKILTTKSGNPAPTSVGLSSRSLFLYLYYITAPCPLALRFHSTASANP